MVARRIGAALALVAMMVPVAGQAAGTAIGTVASGTSALVARDGRVLPATAGMPLFAGDRLITRDGGSANVQMANSCTMTIGASSMLPVSATACSKPSAIGFDEGRAGYAGQSSAFWPNHGSAIWLGVFLAGFGAALYYILHNPHGGHIPVPTSP
jgi:hypothetical protein